MPVILVMLVIITLGLQLVLLGPTPLLQLREEVYTLQIQLMLVRLVMLVMPLLGMNDPVRLLLLGILVLVLLGMML